MKPILIYFNPKDLPQILEEYSKIKCIDKAMFCYFPYPQVIKKAKEWLSKHFEYTHILVASNDIIVKEENVKKLLRVAEKYKTISGVMNVDLKKYRNNWNVTTTLPLWEPFNRSYRWFGKKDYGIIKIMHSGWALMCVERELLLSKTKEGRSFWKASYEGKYGMDLNFSHCCNAEKIPLFADTSNQMLHLRHQGEFLVGKKEPEIREVLNGKS